MIVIGSENPWVEYEVLKIGADHVKTQPSLMKTKKLQVTTSDFTDLSCVLKYDRRLSYIHPTKLQNHTHEYDLAISYSSLEHTGLGRYGDPLNFYGDLMEMARLACIVKPGGFLLLGIPVCTDGMRYNVSPKFIFFVFLGASLLRPTATLDDVRVLAPHRPHARPVLPTRLLLPSWPAVVSAAESKWMRDLSDSNCLHSEKCRPFCARMIELTHQTVTKF